MRRHRVDVLAVALFLSTLAAASPARPGAVSARRGFEALSGLTGAWEFTNGMESGVVSYELVSDGTAILERVMGEEHGAAGMVSVIHLDGDRLALEHYCGVGNQPRLTSPGLEGDEIRFTFDSVTGLTGPNAGHIHSAVFRFPPDGAFESSWTWRENGTDRESVRRHWRSTPTVESGPAGRQPATSNHLAVHQRRADELGALAATHLQPVERRAN